MAGEMVLYYCPEGTAHKNKVKAALVQLGVRIKNITPEQFSQTVGYLLGLPDYESQAEVYQGEALTEEVLVMKGFDSRKMDLLFARLRKAKVPSIALKAVLTETNQGWTFLELYEELKKEHAAMSGESLS